jgi:hypothetical protein
MEGTSYCQKTVPLKAGLYQLELTVKDVYSGNVGTTYEPLLVPSESDMAYLDTAPFSAKQVIRGGSE